MWYVFLFILFVYSLVLVLCMFVFRSSDSSDSHLPIIQRGEGSTEETYDESDREYNKDEHSLSSDMYCPLTDNSSNVYVFLTTTTTCKSVFALGWCIMTMHVSS